MTDELYFALALLLTAGITYLIRMLPVVLFHKEIKSTFVRSFLYYVPYAVLTAMTVPAIFFSTAYLISACVGTAVAVVLAFRRHSLLTVAAFSCLAVFICELIILVMYNPSSFGGGGPH